MRYCRNKIIDRQIKEYEALRNYWKIMAGETKRGSYINDAYLWRIEMYERAIRICEIKKLK